MSPPKLAEPHDAVGSVAPGAIEAHRTYLGRCKELAGLAGVINAAHGALVDVTVEVLAERDHVGPGLHSPAQFLAWRVGCSKATANQVVAVARRVEELPLAVAALRAGEISLEQAAVVARNVPAAYDRAATELAKTSTVEQLKAVLPAYRYEEETAEERERRVRATAARRERASGLSRDEDGGGRLSLYLDPSQTAEVEAALAAAREELFQQRRDDAKAAAAETGAPEAPVVAPTMGEAAAALAAAALAHGAAEHPGSERSLITYHLAAGPDGSPCLTDERGRIVPGAERRRLLCDHRFVAVLHGDDGTPLSVGRATRHIGRKLRRVILHRHRGRCAVPGCDASHGLEIHHIEHWEDGGSTDPSNLVALCHRHHAAHHDGILGVEGDPGRPPGEPGALAFRVHGRVLRPTGVPAPPGPGQTPADAFEERVGPRPGPASTPNGERISRRTFHLEADPPP